MSTNESVYRTFTLHFSEDSLQGLDVPALVLITSMIDAKHNSNAFSRCVSQLIVICEKEQVLHLSNCSSKNIATIVILLIKSSKFCFANI